MLSTFEGPALRCNWPSLCMTRMIFRFSQKENECAKGCTSEDAVDDDAFASIYFEDTWTTTQFLNLKVS